MTEYDYSPAAHERYMRTQDRVSNWVSHSKAHESQYSNPFVASVANGGAPNSPSHSPSSHHESQKLQSNGSNRAATVRQRDGNESLALQRSKSGVSESAAIARPSQLGHGGSQRSRAPDRRASRGSQLVSGPSQGGSFDDIQEHVSTPRSQSAPHSQSHHSHHSHHSHPPSRSQSHGAGSHHSYAPRSIVPMHSPSHSGSGPYGTEGGMTYRSYDARDRSAIHLPAPRPGETYVIMPHKRRVDIISNQGSMVSARI
jgi:hypothetical protein